MGGATTKPREQIAIGKRSTIFSQPAREIGVVHVHTITSNDRGSIIGHEVITFIDAMGQFDTATSPGYYLGTTPSHTPHTLIISLTHAIPLI